MQPQKPANTTTKTQVYLAINGQQSGPFNKTELTQLVKNGTLTPQTLVWEAGMPNWAPASSVPHVNTLLMVHTPKPPKPKAEKTQAAKQEPEKPKAEHPMRADLISAMQQLGFRGPEIAKSVDNLLAEQPDITTAAALKILLKK